MRELHFANWEPRAVSPYQALGKRLALASLTRPTSEFMSSSAFAAVAVLFTIAGPTAWSCLGRTELIDEQSHDDA